MITHSDSTLKFFKVHITCIMITILKVLTWQDCFIFLSITDVLVGSVLGACIMFLCYRQYFPPLTNPSCDRSYASLVSSSDKADFTLNSVMVTGGVDSNPNIKHIWRSDRDKCSYKIQYWISTHRHRHTWWIHGCGFSQRWSWRPIR